MKFILGAILSLVVGLGLMATAGTASADDCENCDNAASQSASNSAVVDQFGSASTGNTTADDYSVAIGGDAEAIAVSRVRQENSQRLRQRNEGGSDCEMCSNAASQDAENEAEVIQTGEAETGDTDADDDSRAIGGDAEAKEISRISQENRQRLRQRNSAD
jgi:hypothetical protein